MTPAVAVLRQNRVPVLSWIHPTTSAPLCRCSQPSRIRRGDAKLLGSIRSTARHLGSMVIIDARPWANAIANTVSGHGYEQVKTLAQRDGRLAGASINFMNIGNIHAVRKAYLAMGKACRSRYAVGCALYSHRRSCANCNRRWCGCVFSGPCSYLEKAGDSGWLQICNKVLQAANNVADHLEQAHPVLVHCRCAILRPTSWVMGGSTV